MDLVQVNFVADWRVIVKSVEGSSRGPDRGLALQLPGEGSESVTPGLSQRRFDVPVGVDRRDGRREWCPGALPALSTPIVFVVRGDDQGTEVVCGGLGDWRRQRRSAR